MLKHRVGNNIALKSETLPRYEGQDEEGEALLESAFDLMQITNSCPDLSIIVDDTTNNNNESHYQHNANLYVTDSNPHQLTVRTEEVVDGRYFNKIPLGFRRSTSLSSLEADGFAPSTIDGTVVGNILQPGGGVVARVIGKLENALHKDHHYSHNQNPSEFTRSSQRSSYNGPPTGYLQKSVSSPSVTQGPRPQNGEEPTRHHNIAQLNQALHLNHQPSTAGSQHSSKRSFFRRKHKNKSGSLNSHPPGVQQYKRGNIDGKMMSNYANGSHGSYSHSYDAMQESLGYSALIDPSLGLQDPDVECWTLFSSPEVVAQLTDKEIKRQEHMYEFIMTEKHHCLTLALMHHLFVNGMRSNGYRRQASLLFPGLHELLQVHIAFFRKLRDKQDKFKDQDRPLDTISDVLLEQFTEDPLSHMARLYGLLCASLEKSLELFKNLKLKDQKFANLVLPWNKEPLLGRKNVPECLLLVAQRISKYPLLIEPLVKTSQYETEKEELSKIMASSKDLNAKVNERVAERQKLVEICQRIDSKSVILDGSKRIRRDDLVLVPSRRLRFHGQALVNFNRVSGNGVATVGNGSGAQTSTKHLPCHVLILTDCLLIMQEISGKLFFVAPPGLVKLNNMIVRERAGLNSSLFLVLGTESNKPEMIELQVLNPRNRDEWLDVIKDAKAKYELEANICSDLEDELAADELELSELKMSKILDELSHHDKQIMSLLKSRSKIIESLRQERPHNWRANSFDGKDDVLNAISVASEEVQRVMRSIEDTGASSSVNRSVSCASEHVASYGVTGLPRRADTFGGFDSQQRSAVELSQCLHSKILFQMVIQLADLCGEMFQQMVPNLTPNVYQANQQVTKRMEDLREATQRLESEKALWRQGFQRQQEELAKQKAELVALKSQLDTEQADISQQREQLYRKLEKLESKGMRPYLDSVSPVTMNDKIPSSITTRRSPSAVSSTTSSGGSSNKQPPKQQLPLHLAAFSSVKSSTNSISTSDLSKSRQQGVGGGGPQSVQTTPGNPNFPPPLVSSMSSGDLGGGVSRHNSSAYVGNRVVGPRGSSLHNSQSTSSMQQMLPLRLSEGNSNSNKSSTLPRGVGSQSINNLVGAGAGQTHEQQQPTQQNVNMNGHPRFRGTNNHFLQHSKSSASILTRNANSGEPTYQQPYPSPGGPNTDRMSNYYRDAQAGGNNVHNVDYSSYANFNNHNSVSNVPIVHRRSGSSPVPMSSTTFQQQQQRAYSQKGGASDDDFDTSKILFL